VGVVRPHDGTRVRAPVGEHSLEGVHHVAVTQVPRLARPPVHGPVVALCLAYDGGVARRIEVTVPVAAVVLHALGEQVGEDGHRLGLAAGHPAACHCAPVRRGVRLPRGEAAVSHARALRGVGIDRLEVVEHRADRVVEAVDVEPMDADPFSHMRDRAVVVIEPGHEVAHLGVAPHPAGESGERRFAERVHLASAHTLVDDGGVGPVCLERDNAEAVATDELSREPRAEPVELARAVRRLADQHDLCGREPVHKPVDRRALEVADGLRAARDKRRERIAARLADPQRAARAPRRPR